MRLPFLNRRLLFAVFFLAGCMVLLAGIHVATFLYVPPITVAVPKIIEVQPGATLRDVSVQLSQEGLITDKRMFILIGRLTGLERKIRPGEYAFRTNMVPHEIMDDLRKGKILQIEFSIPDDASLVQVARLFEEKNILHADEFLRKCRDPAFVASLGVDAKNLEGFLYPDTYIFPRKTPPDDMIGRMVQGFKSRFTEDMVNRAKELHMTVLQIVTLASIIGKETANDEERAIVSAVFHNRMEKGIPLQSDPTVIYAVPNFGGVLTKRNLSYRSAYNTYLHRGLPPGPIGSPNVKSIRAALYPADAPYFYFVSKNDGTHYFSASLAEHNRAVSKYQRKGGRSKSSDPATSREESAHDTGG